jgi:very-short-patch-repair endonuclease
MEVSVLGIPRDLAIFGGTRYGVVGRLELRKLGVSAPQRDRMVGAGLLLPVHTGVYRLAGTPESLLGRCRAVSLANPSAVVTGRAGGKLWELRRMGRVERIEVRVPHSSQSFAAPWILQRRCNRLDRVDVVERPDGIRVVSPPRLAFDLAADLSALDLESVVEQLLDRLMCTVPTLMDTGRRLYHPRRPGSQQFAAVVLGRPTSLKPADSHEEVVLFAALRDAGVRGLVRQHPLELPGGVRIHPDIAVPGLRWAIEVDHVDWHGGRFAVDIDKRRDRQAGALGWLVSRATDRDVNVRLTGVVHELLAIHRTLIRQAS